MMSRREHLRLAQTITRATVDRAPIASLAERYPEMTIDDAERVRAIQLAGQRIVGALAASAGWFAWVTEAMLVELPADRSDGRVTAHVARTVGTPGLRACIVVADPCVGGDTAAVDAIADNGGLRHVELAAALDAHVAAPALERLAAQVHDALRSGFLLISPPTTQVNVLSVLKKHSLLSTVRPDGLIEGSGCGPGLQGARRSP